MQDLIGQSLGRYHILEKLGEGGMATVYKAYDTRLECDVAVKVIRTDQLAPAVLERALKRFEREAKAVARLTHPAIVRVTDYGEYEGSPYLVMEYLPGGTLKEYLKDHDKLDYKEAARLLLPIAEALDYAHEQNLIHRDVKPSNILLTSKSQPMLTDFGVAKVIDEEVTQDLTGTSATVGTPEYMAPEQVVSKTVDQRADIYALGVVLFEMVTGRRPFEADTPMAVLFKHAGEPLPRPSTYSPDLPEEVERILFKALAKKPEDRYQSMGEFVKALARLGREGTPDTIKVNTRPTPMDRIEQTYTTVDQLEAESLQPAPSAPPTAEHSKGGLIAVVLLVTGVVVALVGGNNGWFSYTTKPAPAPTVTPIVQPTNTTATTDTFSYTSITNLLAYQRNWTGNQLHVYEDYFEDPAPTPGYSSFEYESIYVSKLGQQDYRVSELGGCGSPVWSPDGKWIAFIRTSIAWESSYIVIVDVTGNLNKEIKGDFYLNRLDNLSWSIDGKYLVANDYNTRRIVMINVETGTVSTIVYSTAEFVSLSPDGKNIAYMTRERDVNDDDAWLLNIYNINSSSNTKITTANDRFGLLGPFNWTPDGQFVVFEGFDLNGQGQRFNHAFYQVRPDGSDLKTISSPIEIIDQSYFPWFRTIGN